MCLFVLSVSVFSSACVVCAHAVCVCVCVLLFCLLVLFVVAAMLLSFLFHIVVPVIPCESSLCVSLVSLECLLWVCC